MRRSHFFHPDCETMEDRLVMSAAPTTHDLLAAALIEGMSRPRPKPKAPSFTATAISTTEVKLSWTKVPGASRYLIEFWSGGVWVQIGTKSNKTTTFTVHGLQPGTTNYFDVCYVKGRWTYWETWKSVTTFAPPLPVSPPIDHPLAGWASPPPNGEPASYWSQQLGYSVVNDPLFGPQGPQAADVAQQEVGDCWLLSTLAATAKVAPQDITRMFTDDGAFNENGVRVELYTVRFYTANGGSVCSELVDNELPAGGNWADTPAATGVLWVALAEKAYVQAAAQGYLTVMSGAVQTYGDSYAIIDDGLPFWAMSAVTGHLSTSGDMFYGPINPAQIQSALQAGWIVVIGAYENPAPPDPSVAGGHFYAVLTYNPGVYNSQGQQCPFDLLNPWYYQYCTPYYGNKFKETWANGPFLTQNFIDGEFIVAP